MQMTDSQVMTITLSVVVALASLIYSNSRIKEAIEQMNKTVDAVKAALSAEIKGSHDSLAAQIKGSNDSLAAKLDGLRDHIDSSINCTKRSITNNC